MSDGTVSLVLGLVALIGGLSASALGAWSARTSAKAAVQSANEAAKAAVHSANEAAKAAVQSASESAKGVIFDSSAARNAEFQDKRRSEYAALLEALTDDKLSTEVPQRTAKALLVVRTEDLKGKLETLAGNPSAFRGEVLKELAWQMNVDAGK
ncbi:hypothetical protein [Streptomyces sp. NPDC006307]|uniref:hypothetical protein n=1 Tax=Streptomyces sp. NPDC006307 TaxID=3156748 RepID=UPI0033BA9822